MTKTRRKQRKRVFSRARGDDSELRGKILEVEQVDALLSMVPLVKGIGRTPSPLDMGSVVDLSLPPIFRTHPLYVIGLVWEVLVHKDRG